MEIINSFLISALLIINEASFTKFSADQKDCNSLELNYKFEQEPNSEKFALKITASGGTAPYKVALSRLTGELVTEDFEKTYFKSLDKGKYICVIIDNARCMKKSEISIQ